MRLLLTRAAADALRTQTALAARGHEVLVSPLIEIVAIPSRWPAGDTAAIVATSAQAFAMAPDVPSDLRGTIPLYLVGERTQAAARRRGFDGPATTVSDAASLLRTFDATLALTQHVVYLTGRDRKPDVKDFFDARGQVVTVVETYEARATGVLTSEAVSALREGRIDAVLHFSRRSAVLFLAAAASVEISSTEQMHLCLSDDVAAPLREVACRRLKTAKAPNEAALLFLVD